ncbi:MAG: hypothetical protein ACFFG0_48565, partial [Candidatus Thorarchaeota archaeon]
MFDKKIENKIKIEEISVDTGIKKHKFSKKIYNHEACLCFGINPTIPKEKTSSTSFIMIDFKNKRAWLVDLQINIGKILSFAYNHNNNLAAFITLYGGLVIYNAKTKQLQFGVKSSGLSFRIPLQRTSICWAQEKLVIFCVPEKKHSKSSILVWNNKEQLKTIKQFQCVDPNKKENPFTTKLEPLSCEGTTDKEKCEQWEKLLHKNQIIKIFSYKDENILFLHKSGIILEGDIAENLTELKLVYTIPPESNNLNLIQLKFVKKYEKLFIWRYDKNSKKKGLFIYNPNTEKEKLKLSILLNKNDSTPMHIAEDEKTGDVLCVIPKMRYIRIISAKNYRIISKFNCNNNINYFYWQFNSNRKKVFVFTAKGQISHEYYRNLKDILYYSILDGKVEKVKKALIDALNLKQNISKLLYNNLPIMHWVINKINNLYLIRNMAMNDSMLTKQFKYYNGIKKIYNLSKTYTWDDENKKSLNAYQEIAKLLIKNKFSLFSVTKEMIQQIPDSELKLLIKNSQTFKFFASKGTLNSEIFKLIAYNCKFNTEFGVFKKNLAIQCHNKRSYKIITAPKRSKDYNILSIAYDSNTNWVAFFTSNKYLYVYDLTTNKYLLSKELKKDINKVSMCWSQKKLLFFATKNGCLGIIVTWDKKERKISGIVNLARAYTKKGKTISILDAIALHNNNLKLNRDNNKLEGKTVEYPHDSFYYTKKFTLLNMFPYKGDTILMLHQSGAIFA